MKQKILLLILFFFIIILITFIEYKDSKINYTIIGNKESFQNNIISKNYSDLVSDYLKKHNLLKKSNKNFIYNDIRVTDLIDKIDKNIKEENNTLQNTIHESNILILSIGNNEINYKLNNNKKLNDIEIYKYLDEIVDDINKLIEKIKKVSNTKIIFIGYYNENINTYNNRYYKYINNKIKKNKKVIFIDLYNILKKDYIDKDIKVYINNKGNLAIYDKIISKVKRIYLKK